MLVLPRATSPRVVSILLVALVAALAHAASASAGYSIKHAAADPRPDRGPYLPVYDRLAPADLPCPTPTGSTGRASAPLPHAVAYAAPPLSSNYDAVTSLAPPDVTPGRIVPFEIEVVATASAGGALRIDPYFATKTTAGDDFGYDPAYGVYCAFVDTDDPGTVESGGDARVSAFSHAITDPATSNEEIAGRIDLSGVQAGDRVIVEVWVVLKPAVPAGASGNVQTGLLGATEQPSGTTINVGNQTVPLLRVGQIASTEPDLAITKTASPSTAAPGTDVTFTLEVMNNGAVAASGVAITDPLPEGVSFVSADPGCTYDSTTRQVTCLVPTLEADATVTREIVVRVSTSFTFPTTSPHDHQLTVNRVEQVLDLDPAQEQTVALTCPGDAIMTDGSAWVQQVDQGTGTLADVKVLTTRSTAPGTYEFRVRNDSAGRAQVRLVGTCADRGLTTAEGHSHDLLVSPSSGPATTQTVAAAGAGRHEFTFSCDPGEIPVAPGFTYVGGEGRLVVWDVDEGAGTWTLGIETAGPALVEMSARCLDRETSFVEGHRHELAFTHPESDVVVPPTADRSAVFKQSCGGEEKGILATYGLQPGLVIVGHVPVPVEREFHLMNPTAAPIDATVDLLCVAVRTGEIVRSASIENTATVSHDGVDSVPGNDSDTATITVQPGPGLAALRFTSLRTTARPTIRYRITRTATVRLYVRRANGRKVIARATRRGRRGTHRVTLPRTLKRGDYRITVTARDRKGRYSGALRREFRVVTPRR